MPRWRHGRDVAVVIRGARLRRGAGGTSGCTRGLRCVAGAPLWWLAGRSGTPRGQFATQGTVRDAGDSLRRGGQFATRWTVRDGAAAATAAGHGGRVVCGRRRAAAAVAGVVAGAFQRRSSRGGGGSLPRRASTAFDSFRLDTVKHMAAPVLYALAGGRDGRGTVGGPGARTTAVGSPTTGSCSTRGSHLIYSPTCRETCLDKC